MDLTPPRISLSLLAAILAGLLSVGCEHDGTDSEPAPEPWRYDSKKAAYSLEVPGQWEQIPAEEINRFADLAMNLGDRFYVIVIPQELPSFEGVETPDALALKRASLSLLRERIDDFEIERQGPMKLGGRTALSVFAEGTNEGQPVQYINTYVTRGDWGYQIVAWGPRKQEDGLVAATDELLSGWTFTGANTSSSNTDAAGQAEENGSN